MHDRAQTVDSLPELRKFVHEVLCERENLLPEESPLEESPLHRCGAPCGLQFLVHGPRAVRLSAIWVARENIVYFYDARGERFLKISLRNRFELAA